MLESRKCSRWFPEKIQVDLSDIEIANANVNVSSTEELLTSREDLTNEVRQALNEAIQTYEKKLLENPKDLSVEHEILLTNSKPVNVRERRIPYSQRDDIGKQILDLLWKKNYSRI